MLSFRYFPSIRQQYQPTYAINISYSHFLLCTVTIDEQIHPLVYC